MKMKKTLLLLFCLALTLSACGQPAMTAGEEVSPAVDVTTRLSLEHLKSRSHPSRLPGRCWRWTVGSMLPWRTTEAAG